MKPPYTQQRFHPSLQICHTALLAGKKKDIPAHCQQGDIDGACGTYVAAIALAMLNKIANAATIASHRSGVAARLWKAAHAVYFNGISSAELHELLVNLDADLLLAECSSKHREILDFARESVDAGCIVLVSYRTRNYSECHWTAVVGVSGRKEGGAFYAEAFLCLDPGQPPPDMGGYNGKLNFCERLEGFGRTYVAYRCSGDSEALGITLTGAIAISNRP